MNTLDTMLLVVLVISTGLGLYWGLIRQVLSVVGLIAGITLATHYGGRVADSLSSFISNEMATHGSSGRTPWWAIVTLAEHCVDEHVFSHAAPRSDEARRTVS